MKKILLAAMGALSIATAVMAHPVVTHIAPSAAATAGYSQARVLQPGSRGSVVEI